MYIKKIVQKIENTALALYQNKEQEGFEGVAELLLIFQEIIRNMTKQQKICSEKFALLMLKELLENYNAQDVIGMADCLMIKANLFVEFMIESEE